MKLATRVYNLQLLYRRQLCTSNLLSYAHKHEISAVISNKSLQWKNLYNLPFYNLRSLSKYFHQSCVVSLHHSQLLQKESVTSLEYEHVSNEVLENLTEKLEFLLEDDNAPSECDITFSSGVLTLKLGKHGTYVINKQSPNKQIWLSSPLSGPKRYDFIENDWIYKNDKSFLFDLLSQELSTIFNKNINLRDDTIYSDLKIVDKLLGLLDNYFFYFTMPLEISKFVNCCKDFLHAEWTVYKKQGFIKPCPVCIYSIGSEDTIPIACIGSIGNGFIEIERALREHFYLAVDMNSPIVSQDVMVWADGQITLFPPRKQKPVEEPVPSTANEPKSLLPPGPPGGRKPRPPQTPRAAFMSAIEQIANYMVDHLKRVSESCLLAGNIKILYYVLSSATLIKCRIMTYKSVMRTPLSKSLSTAVTRSNEMIEVITQHILNYHSDLIRSSIVHDAPSTDWTCGRAYEEDERISVCIQMWSFYMQGIRNDLWRSTSTKVGETILNNILVDTLSLFVTRVVQVKPSDVRLNQMRADITTIFLVAASFIFSLAPSPRHFFRGDIHDSVVFPIHRRMDLLLRVAALKCAPVETISKVYSSGIRLSKSCCVNSKEPTEIVSCPSWLTFLNRRLFPPDTRQLSSLPDEVAVYLTLHNAALRPYPNQGLILRGLFMRNFLASKVLLKYLQDIPWEVTKGSPCGGALCLGHLCTPPLIPHTVYSAAVQILISSYSSTHILSDVIQASIKDSGNWDSLDRMHVWNIQRPPWHHAFVQLIAVHITPVVAKVLEVLPAEPPAQPAHPSQLSIRLEHHLSAWTLQLIKGVGEMGDAIPKSLVYISETVNGMLPPTIKPVGGHVISQFVISAIYSIINSRSSLDQLSSTGFITDGQWDMMIAVGERLCSLHDGNYNDALEKMTAALLQQLTVETETDDENLDDYTNEDAIEEVCQEMADSVMASNQGVHSFGAVWEYLKRNMEWLGHALKAPTLLPHWSSFPSSKETPISTPKPTPKMKPPPKMSFSPLPHILNPLRYCNKIFFSEIDHESLIGFKGDWESVLESDLWMSEYMVKDLLKGRPELQEEAILTPAEAAAVQKLKVLLY